MSAVRISLLLFVLTNGPCEQLRFGMSDGHFQYSISADGDFPTFWVMANPSARRKPG
jgi:hypothetical protein